MSFFYSNDGRSFSTTLSYSNTPQIFLTPKGVNDNRAASIIQNWWKKCNMKTEQDASILIQNWWRNTRRSPYYYLFVENSNFNIDELYERLLSIIIPGIEYICVKKISIFPKCILVKTTLDKITLNAEIKDVLSSVGYNYQFVINEH